jgi:hypothetical protein
VRTLISIDWDFFFPNLGEVPHAVVGGTQDGKKVSVPAMFLYDWGHNESWAKALTDLMWSTSRFSGFHRVGLDITREYNIREDLGHVTPEEFMAFLEQFYLDDDTPLFYADSHTLGAVAAQDAAYEGPVHVDSFDAHGDLGYNEKEMKRAEEGSVSCSSWLYGVLKADLASSATVVYPDWKGLAEIEQER